MMRKTDNHSEPPSLVELIDKEFNEQLNISKNTSEKLDDDDIKSQLSAIKKNTIYGSNPFTQRMSQNSSLLKELVKEIMLESGMISLRQQQNSKDDQISERLSENKEETPPKKQKTSPSNSDNLAKYQHPQSIESILGLTLEIKWDSKQKKYNYQEQIIRYTNQILDNFIIQEKENLSDTMINEELKEFKSQTIQLQNEYSDIKTQLLQMVSKNDLRIPYLEKNLTFIQNAIFLNEKVNPIKDKFYQDLQPLHRQIKYQKSIEQLIEKILKVEINFSFELKRVEVERLMNASEREKQLKEEIKKLKKELQDNQDQLQQIENDKIFVLSGIQEFTSQIDKAQKNIVESLKEIQSHHKKIKQMQEKDSARQKDNAYLSNLSSATKRNSQLAYKIQTQMESINQTSTKSTSFYNRLKYSKNEKSKSPSKKQNLSPNQNLKGIMRKSINKARIDSTLNMLNQ